MKTAMQGDKTFAPVIERTFLFTSKRSNLNFRDSKPNIYLTYLLLFLRAAHLDGHHYWRASCGLHISNTRVLFGMLLLLLMS